MSRADMGVVGRWAWAEIDAAAIEHNVAVLRGVVEPSSLWAVVKADGYGHGAELAARAALRAGAAGLCVALVQEGVALRRAGLTAPILVLSEQPPGELAAAVTADLTSTVYRMEQVEHLAAVATAAGAVHRVHLKVDTGMHRVGCDPGDAVSVARAVAASPALELDGVFTHLALADEPADPFTDVQLERFDAVLGALDAAGLLPQVVHAANSAGALAHPRARRSMVRAGIAIYGISPGPGVDHLTGALRPAFTLRARVSMTRRVAAGEGVSYGLRHRVAVDTTLATVPIGYADGMPRRLFATGGEVLIGGRRRPIVGVVTMDQVVVDVGDDPVVVGDEVVVLGRQGDEEITATEWARRLDTIGYEIVCGISQRIARRPGSYT